MTTMTNRRVRYTAKTHTTDGREGESHRTDSRLASSCRYGTPANDANLEQFFADRWSVCFEGAKGRAARKMRVTLRSDVAIDAELDLCVTDGEYSLPARLMTG
jgi:osmotically inducible protein OsmC